MERTGFLLLLLKEKFATFSIFFFSFWILNFTINGVHNKTDESKAAARSLPRFGNKPSVVGSFCLAHEDFD